MTAPKVGPQGSYRTFIQLLVENGDVVESRIGLTSEMLGVTAIFSPGTLVTRPKLNDAIGWSEMLQLIAGIYTPDVFRKVAPNASLELFTYAMAYGPRIAGQMPAIITELKENPTSRRAVAIVADPVDGPTNELPCTISMQWLIRDGYLDMNVAMRSWDAISGLSYDIVMFGGLQLALAHVLGWPAGLLRVHAGSLHLYHKDKERIPPMDVPQRGFKLDLESLGISRDWEEVQQWAETENALLEKGRVPAGITIFTEE